MRVVFRVDSSSSIGSGHVVRCLSLAKALIRHGHTAYFITSQFTGNLVNRIDQIANDTYVIPHRPDLVYFEQRDFEIDLEHTSKCLKLNSFDWLVVDNYQLNYKWESVLKGLVSRIMVIDDFVDRPHSCDLFLNQNILDDPKGLYSELLPAHARLLLGPKFCLLDEAYRLARQNLNLDAGVLKKRPQLVISFGGSDPTGLTLRLGKQLTTKFRDDFNFHIVIGPGNLQSDLILSQLGGGPNVKISQAPTSLVEIILESDVCVGAGGTSVWERICLGLPSIVIPTVHNQVVMCQRLSSQGFLVNLGQFDNSTIVKLSSVLHQFLDGSMPIAQMTEKGLGLVDGLGADRVVRCMTL